MIKTVTDTVREFVVWWLGLFGVNDPFWINGAMTVVAGFALLFGVMFVLGLIAALAESR